jgi:hypothetical protein
MKKREILLWVVAVGALCLSLLALFGSKLLPLRSDAALNSLMMTQSETLYQERGTGSKPVLGETCTIENGQEVDYGKVEAIRGPDGTIIAYRCVKRGIGQVILAEGPVR